MKRLLILLTILFCSVFLQAAELRTWTGSNGKKIEAELLFFDQESEIVHIRLKNGKEQRVKLPLFSQKDQDYVKNIDKTDDPFSSGEPKTTGPLRIVSSQKFDKDSFSSFLLRESENAIQKIDKSSLKPTDYANLGIVQALCGNTEGSAKSFNAALLLNEQQSSNMQEFFFMRIAHAAIVANQLEYAEKCLDVLKKANHPWSVEVSGPLAEAYVKNGNRSQAEKILKEAAGFVNKQESMQKNKGMHLRPIAASWANIGNFPEAISVAAQSPTQDVLSITLIAKASILSKGKAKTKEYVSILEDTNYSDTFKIIVAKAWLDAGNVDEAYSLSNRIQNVSYKSYLLREIGLKHFVDGDTEKAKRMFTDSLRIKTDNWGLYYERFVLETISELTGIIGEKKNIEIETDKTIRKESKKSDMYKYLFNIALYRKLLDEDSYFESIVSEMEEVGFSNEDDYESLCQMWLAVASGLDLLADKEKAAHYMSKAQRAVLRVSDPKKRENLSKSFKDTPNSSIMWSRTPTPIYDNRIVGHLSMLRLTADLLIQLNRPDKAQDLIRNVELPEAKLYLCRLFAETVHTQKP